MKMIIFFTDNQLGAAPGFAVGTAADSSNRLAMIHGNPSHLRMIVNGQNLFDDPLEFSWQTTLVRLRETRPLLRTYYYDPNKSSYLRSYELVQKFFAKTYGTEVSITAEDYCNNWFIMPINLNQELAHGLSKNVRYNISINYEFATVTNSPI